MSVTGVAGGKSNELLIIDDGISDFGWRDFLVGVGVFSDFGGDVGCAFLDGFVFLLLPYFAS